MSGNLLIVYCLHNFNYVNNTRLICDQIIGAATQFTGHNRSLVPVHEAVMMFSIALRFLPLLLEEFDKIRKAQTARGGGFHRKGVITRFRGVLPMLVPLFVLAIIRAKELATAMESRCYLGDKRANADSIIPIRVSGLSRSDSFRYTARSYYVLIINEPAI
jgi:hypothetical protein